MTQTGALKILFVAGFGPIAHEETASHRLYKNDLGIAFKEEGDGYLHTEALKGARTFAAGEIQIAADRYLSPIARIDDAPACSVLRTAPTLLALTFPSGTTRELRYIAAFGRPARNERPWL